MRRCLSSLNISLCINSVDVWVSFFLLPFSIPVFFRACFGSRTLYNANKSTPSGEVPLRLSEFSELTLTLKYIQKRDYWGWQLGEKAFFHAVDELQKLFSFIAKIILLSLKGDFCNLIRVFASHIEGATQENQQRSWVCRLYEDNTTRLWINFISVCVIRTLLVE